MSQPEVPAPEIPAPQIVMPDVALPYSADCFVCGSTPSGLNVRFRRTHEGAVYTQVTFPTLYQGFTEVVHGGIQTSVLDELALWAATLEARDYVMTQEMTVRFFKSVRTGRPYTARSRFVSRDGDMSTAEAMVVDDKGTVCTQLNATFRPMPGRLANAFETQMIYPPDASPSWRIARHVGAPG